MTWLTTFDDEVGAGDVVALSIPGMPADAIGLIVGPGSDGRITCELGAHDQPHGRRAETLEVEAYQLRMLLRGGGETEGGQGLRLLREGYSAGDRS